MVDIIPFDPIYNAPVYGLVEKFFEESLSSFGLKLDHENIENYVESHSPSSFLMLKDGQVIGIVGGFIDKQVMSDKLVYHETMWYVHPDHRAHGVKLLKHLENWCIGQGITQLIMAFMHNTNADRMMKFFTCRGSVTMETI
jgi:GNAT superfamily N-acetyltransferase